MYENNELIKLLVSFYNYHYTLPLNWDARKICRTSAERLVQPWQQSASIMINKFLHYDGKQVRTLTWRLLIFWAVVSNNIAYAIDMIRRWTIKHCHYNIRRSISMSYNLRHLFVRNDTIYNTTTSSGNRCNIF